MPNPVKFLLTGDVYCAWNAFSYVAPVPNKMQDGDLVVWSWSGNSRNPSSKSTHGLLRASVVYRGRRHLLKLNRSRLHAWLRYQSEDDREEKLGHVIRELRALKGRLVTKSRFGYAVEPDDPPACSAAGKPSPAKPVPAAGDPVQCAAVRRAPGVVAPTVAAVPIATRPTAPVAMEHGPARPTPVNVKPPRRKRRRRAVDERQLILL